MLVTDLGLKYRRLAIKEDNFLYFQIIAQLERELSYLGGMCAGSLIKKDILLPPGKYIVKDNLNKNGHSFNIKKL